ncbi:MAG: hypothetical protein ACXWXK_04270 [Actinomycetota bacterium]
MPSPRHRRGRPSAARYRRRRVAVAAGLGVVVAGVVGYALLRDGGVERDCSQPEELRTRGTVTLIPKAMDAFVEAEASVGTIEVVESFRSCREQALACERICGRHSCPGACAPPGLSWHQRAGAIDVTQAMLDTPGVIEAVEDAGWCQALPDTDPGHFSFDGCH